MIKKIIYLIFCQMVVSCIFVYDPSRGQIHFYNDTNKSVYVYLDYRGNDSIPEIPRRVFLRPVEAGDSDVYTVNGSREHPSLLNIKKITIFVLGKDMVDNHTLKEIHDQQIYEKKIILTEEDLKAINWEIIYPFEKNKINPTQCGLDIK